MATNSREARRRRISEGGSDRLALITGRIQSISSSSSSPRIQHERSNSSQPFPSHDQDLLPQASDFPHDKDKASDSMLSEHNDPAENRGVGSVNGYDGNRAEPYLRKGSMSSIEELVAPAAEVSSQVHPTPVLSTVQNSSVTSSDTQQYSNVHIDWELFTVDKIRSAIAASETTRLYCSLTIALLVVLSYLGFPILGCNMIKSIIAFRPLYLVLLTNLTVVLAELLLNKQNGSRKAVREDNNTSVDVDVWIDLLGKGLKAGLLMQKVMDAVVQDCSVYAIVVICGLSLV